MACDGGCIGIGEKVLAAKRAGMKYVLLSKENEKDVEQINKDFIKDLEFVYVDRLDQVLDYALLS